MIVIGLTGSIAMGKSTAAAMLETLGVPVHDADDTVHELLQPGSKAMLAIAAAFPYFEYPDLYGKKVNGVRIVKREKLSDIVFGDEEARQTLEDILHPFVREAQTEFIRKEKAMGRKIVALDIPLLFETGGELLVDHTIVVSAPAHIQQARALDRPNMDEEKLAAILERQMPDGEKCARADFVVKTGLNRADTMKQLKTVLQTIKKENASPNE